MVNIAKVSDVSLIVSDAGEASVVLANGDHTLGHYEGGHLHGVVREEEEGGLVTRELTYIRGRRHGAWREWRAGDLTCVARAGAMWTRTRSHYGIKVVSITFTFQRRVISGWGGCPRFRW